jgi:hypothetical protein
MFFQENGGEQRQAWWSRPTTSSGSYVSLWHSSSSEAIKGWGNSWKGVLHMCKKVDTKWKWRPKSIQHSTLLFPPVIDGPKKFDPRIRLFPWLESVVQPYHEFRRWVPPPPNPPEMTFQEKQEAGCKRVSNPPLCHCGRPSKLQVPDLCVVPL